MSRGRNHRKLWSLAVSAGVSSACGTVALAGNTPISLTFGSYTYNTVVTSGTPGSSAVITGGTPATVDTENGITFWASSYNSSQALPAAGSNFVSNFSSSTQFQLQSFASNNTMLINADDKYSGGGSPYFAPPYGQTGSISLSTPAGYSTLAILYTTAGQNYSGTIPPINYTLNFADGSTYNNSGAATFTAYSWGNSTNAAAHGYRVWANPNSNYGLTSGTNWYLHEADITVPAADQYKALSSISFFDSGTGHYIGNNATQPNSLAIYGLSGSTTPPQLTYQGNDPSDSGVWDKTSTLNFLATSATPATTSAYTDGAFVTFDDSAPGPRAVTVPASVLPGTVTFANNNSNYSFSGAGGIAGTATVTMNGSASVTFSNVNPFTGATQINSGSLVIASGGSIGSTAINVSTGATFAVLGAGTPLASTAVVTNSGTFNLSSASVAIASLSGTTTTATTNIDSLSTLNVGSGSYLGSLNLAAGSLIKAGTGTLILGGVNTFAGPTTVTAGTLTLSQTGSSYTGGTFAINSTGTLDLLVGGSTQISSGELSTILSKTTLNSGSILALDTTGGSTVLASSLPTGGYGFTKFGTNSLTLSASNSYTGATLLSAGTLVLANPAALAGTSTLTFSTGTTLDIATNGSDTAYPINFGTTSTINIQSDLATAGAGINHTLGTLSAGGGTVNVSAGANVTSGTASLTIPTVILTSGTAVTTTFNPTTATLSLGSVTGTNNTLTHTLGLGGTSFGNSVTGPIANGSTGAVNVIKSGVGSWTLSGSSTYTGTTVLSGGQLIVTGSIGNSSTIQIGSTASAGAALYESGSSATVNNLSTNALEVGYATGAGGYFNNSGGTTSVGSGINVGGSSGGSGTFGEFDMTGGTLNIANNSNSAVFVANRGGNAEASVVNVTGGTVQITGGAPTDGNNNGLVVNWSANQSSVITIGTIGNTAPSGSFLIPTMTVKLNHGTSGGAATGGATGVSSILNLNGGGLLQTLGFLNGTAANDANVFIGFNGGTLKAGSAANASFLQNIGGVYVYANGGTIDNNGQSITIGQPFLAPTQTGVTGVAIATAGAGYLTPPKIIFSGGGGTGATGYATISPTTGAVTGIVVTSPGTGYTSTPTATLTGIGGSTAAVLGNVSTANVLSGGLTFTGVGTTTLPSASTYTGLTSLTGGTLVLDHSSTNTGSLVSNVAVGSSGSFLIKGVTSIGGLSTTGSGASISLVDGSIGSLAVNGNLSLASGSVINLEVGSTAGSSDMINASGTGSLTGVSTVNLVGSTLAGGDYTLLTSSGGFTPGGGGKLTVGTHPAGRFGSFSFAHTTTTSEILSVAATAFSPVDYWTGAASLAAGDTNYNWSTGSTRSNFSVDAAGANDQNQIPGPVTDVIFTATNAKPSSGNALVTRLDNNFTIQGLFFAVPTLSTQITSAVVNPNGYTLAVGTDGLIVTSGSLSSGNIASGNLVLGTSQTWSNNNSSRSLTVNANISAGSSGTTLTLGGLGGGGVMLGGTISDGAGPLSLIFGQTGTTTLGGANTFTGGATVNSGTVAVTNASGLGAGPVTINGGTVDLSGTNLTIATIAGSGGQITDTGAAATLTLGAGSYGGAIHDGTGKLSLTSSAASGTAVVISGVNTYSGSTTLASGTLQLGSTSAASAASPLIVASVGTLDLNGNSVAYKSLSGGGVVTTTGGSATLTLSTASPTTFSGAITDGYGQVSLAYNGSGTQILNGSNTFSGGTTVSSGKLAAYSSTALGTGTVKLSGGVLSLSSGSQLNTSAAFTLNGGATKTGSVIQTTDGGASEATSAFANNQVLISDTNGFSASYVYQASSPLGANSSWADGTLFVLQNDSRGASAVGANGGALGYAGGTVSSGVYNAPVTPSAAIAINLYSAYAGQTYLTTNGSVSPAAGNTFNTFLGNGFSPQPQPPSTATVGDPILVTLVYSGTNLTETETDTATNQTFSNTYSIDLAQTLGGSAGGSAMAYVGFTGATGGITATQTVSNFSITTGSAYANNLEAESGTTSGIELTSTSGRGSAQVGNVSLLSGSVVNLTSVNIAPYSHGLLTASSLSVAGGTNNWTALLNVGNNDLDIQNGSLSDITNQVAQGYNLAGGGKWQGSGGITSSAAAADSSHLTALGVIQNNVNGTPLYGIGAALGTFDGLSPGSNDVLVKYTYFGDANLDGKVDGSDYSLIDAGYAAAGNLSGWYNGDFNYDGVIDGSDYALIDNSFNNQGNSLSSTALVATTTAQVATPAAVPEPASLGLLAIVSTGLAIRRRRH